MKMKTDLTREKLEEIYMSKRWKVEDYYDIVYWEEDHGWHGILKDIPKDDRLFDILADRRDWFKSKIECEMFLYDYITIELNFLPKN